MSAYRTIFLTAGASALAGAGLSVWSGWGSPAWWALPALIIAVCVSEAAAVQIVIGRQGFMYTLSDAIIAVAFVLAPGAWAVVAVVAGFGLANARTSGLKLFFNVSQYTASVAAGVAVAVASGGGFGGAVAGLVVFYLLNHLLTAIPVSLTSGESYQHVLRMVGPLGVIHFAGNSSIGLLGAWLSVNAPLGLLGLVVPLGLLWWSYQQQTRRASEARLFAELASGQERAGGTVDASAQVILTAAARLFGGAEVELLLRHPDGLVKYVGDEHGVKARLRAEADSLDAPWVLRALAAGGIHAGHDEDEDRPYCSAVLGAPERPVAVLIARRPVRARAFARSDLQLVEVLVGQAESWLSAADLATRHDEAVGRAEAADAASRVLGELGTETVPALAVLRESAKRLSQVASSFDGPDPVSDIVSELHSVERAVAALLGAIALTSEPGPSAAAVTGSLGGPAAQKETEWTTTGRIEDAVTR